MARKLPMVLTALLFVGFALHAYDQDLRISRLRADLETLRSQSVRADPEAVPSAPRPGQAWADEDAPPAASQAPSQAQPPAVPQPRAPAPLPAAPRAPVTQDELARVESAVLNLLDSDRPELRDKIRAVVDEQREAADHAQQEQRRERWIARTEARLAELSGPGALTAAQRQAVLDVMLANRDQIFDVMRNAQTGESFTAARSKVQQLRADTETRIRELLNEEQYKAYKQTMDRDDDDRRPPARPAP